jgi:hypothetical protein
MMEVTEAAVREAEFAHECRVRDLYATRMSEFRPGEVLIGTETCFAASNRRADLKSVDAANILRLYEFKLVAGPAAIGQVLTYVHLEQHELGYGRDIRGVLAAFRFEPDVIETIRAMHLPIEIVMLPPHLARAGGVPIGYTASKPLPTFSMFVSNL